MIKMVTRECSIQLVMANFVEFWLGVRPGPTQIYLDVPYTTDNFPQDMFFLLVVDSNTTVGQIRYLQPIFASIRRRNRIHANIVCTANLQPGVLDELLLALRAIPQLITLVLSPFAFDDHNVADLAAFLPTLPCLETLSISRGKGMPVVGSLAPLIRCLRLCPQFRHLHHYVDYHTDNELTALTETLPYCRQLTRLFCISNRLSWSKSELVRILPRCMSLRALAVQPCPADYEGVNIVQWALKRMPRLTAIAFHGWEFLDWQANGLDTIAQLGNIKKLHFIHCRFSINYLGVQLFSDRIWRFLLRIPFVQRLSNTPRFGLLSFLPMLREMEELAMAFITTVEPDIFFARICAALPSCKELRAISFQRTADSIAALPVLAAVLPQILKLRFIMLHQYHGTTADVGQLLNALRSCRQLRQLEFTDVGDMETTVPGLAEIVPSCRLLYNVGVHQTHPAHGLNGVNVLSGRMEHLARTLTEIRNLDIHEAIFILLLCLKREMGPEFYVPVELLLIMMHNYFD